MSATILTSIITAFGTALVTTLASFIMQERRMQFEFAQMRTEFMAEQVARQLLEHKNWKRRSFKAINYRLGDAFADDELRKILVRAGAIRFEDGEGKEYWGLISRNQDILNS